jgi:hypothetical protein
VAESRVKQIKAYVDRHADEIESTPKLQLIINLGAGKPNVEVRRFDPLEPCDERPAVRRLAG